MLTFLNKNREIALSVLVSVVFCFSTLLSDAQNEKKLGPNTTKKFTPVDSSKQNSKDSLKLKPGNSAVKKLTPNNINPSDKTKTKTNDQNSSSEDQSKYQRKIVIQQTEEKKQKPKQN